MAATNRKFTSGAASVSAAPSPLAPAKKEAAMQPATRRTGGGEAGVGKRATRVERMPEDIDASAEEFIKRFRENLLLQRLESLENYKEMLARGA